MKLSKCTMHFKNAAYYISPGFSMLCSASSPVPHMKMYEALQQWNLHGGPGMQPETRSSHVHNGTETFYQDCNLAICSARTVQPCIYSLSWKHNNFLRSPTAVWILPYDLFERIVEIIAVCSRMKQETYKQEAYCQQPCSIHQPRCRHYCHYHLPSSYY